MQFTLGDTVKVISPGSVNGRTGAVSYLYAEDTRPYGVIIDGIMWTFDDDDLMRAD